MIPGANTTAKRFAAKKERAMTELFILDLESHTIFHITRKLLDGVHCQHFLKVVMNVCLTQPPMTRYAQMHAQTFGSGVLGPVV